MKKVTVYGSLKKGKYNHHLLHGCAFLGNTIVKGTMYSVGMYPALVEEGDNEYEAEVYEVPDSIYDYIYLMELGAGYKAVTVGDSTVFYADTELKQRCVDNYQIISNY